MDPARAHRRAVREVQVGALANPTDNATGGYALREHAINRQPAKEMQSDEQG